MHLGLFNFTRGKRRDVHQSDASLIMKIKSHSIQLCMHVFSFLVIQQINVWDVHFYNQICANLVHLILYVRCTLYYKLVSLRSCCIQDLQDLQLMLSIKPPSAQLQKSWWASFRCTAGPIMSILSRLGCAICIVLVIWYRDFFIVHCYCCCVYFIVQIWSSLHWLQSHYEHLIWSLALFRLLHIITLGKLFLHKTILLNLSLIHISEPTRPY